MIYADYNSTSPMHKDAKAVIWKLVDLPLNASSLHSYGQKTQQIVEYARNNVIKKIQMQGAKLIFTSSGTEANNMLIKSLNPRSQHISSTIEHKSVIECHHPNRKYLSVDRTGIINLNKLERMLDSAKPNMSAVSIMMANNETGILQPIHTIAQLCHQYKAVLHTDAVQALGKIPITMQNIGADAITFSGHKIGSCLGTGILLYNPEKISIKPILKGGGQESGLRAGTENALSIASFDAIFAQIDITIKQYQTHVMVLRNQFERGIIDITQNADLIIGYNLARLPNTSLVVMPNTSSDTQIIYFNLHEIAVSNGSACSSGTVEGSHVLDAMGIHKNTSKCAIRFSFGPGNTKEEIDSILNRWETLYQKNN